jgi:predicted NAD/FAD-binding protein
VCLHYWINRLQPLPFARDVFVTLNPCRAPRVSSVLARFPFAHPVFDLGALTAQERLPAIQGHRRTWFAGAWCGYGFHEDGFQAGRRAAVDVLEALGARSDRDPAGATRVDCEPIASQVEP